MNSRTVIGTCIGITGNEKADDSAKERQPLVKLSLKKCTKPPLAHLSYQVDEFVINDTNKRWKYTPGCKISKALWQKGQ